MDGNDQLDLDLDSEHNDQLESDLLSDTEDRSISVVPNSSKIGLKFENTNLLVLHSTPPVEFFKLFINDDFETKMAEHSCSKRHTTIIQASI